MSQQQNHEAPVTPTLCANNCGFYGNAANNFLCSKCYKAFTQQSRACVSSSCTEDKKNQTVSTISNNNDKSCDNQINSNVNEQKIINENKIYNKNTNIDNDNNDKINNNNGNLNETLCNVSNDFKNNVNDNNIKGISVNSINNTVEIKKIFPVSVDNICNNNNSNTEILEINNNNDIDKNALNIKSIDKAKPIQENKNRCWKCNKKLGLVPFTCRCGYNFCVSHRYSDSHDCEFNYKSYEREQLSKQNARVVADKLERI